MTQTTTLAAPPAHWPTKALREISIEAHMGAEGLREFKTFILAEHSGSDPRGTIWWPRDGGQALAPHWHWSAGDYCALQLWTESPEVSALIDAHLAALPPVDWEPCPRCGAQAPCGWSGHPLPSGFGWDPVQS